MDVESSVVFPRAHCCKCLCRSFHVSFHSASSTGCANVLDLLSLFLQRESLSPFSSQILPWKLPNPVRIVYYVRRHRGRPSIYPIHHRYLSSIPHCSESLTIPPSERASKARAFLFPRSIPHRPLTSADVCDRASTSILSRSQFRYLLYY